MDYKGMGCVWYFRYWANVVFPDSQMVRNRKKKYDRETAL